MSLAIRFVGASLLSIMCAGCATTTVDGVEDKPDGKTAMAAFVAFSCSVYAEMAGKADEKDRLFTLGYENGRRFVDDVRSKRIDEEDLRKNVPIGVMMVLKGPTTEFMLGRIYENASVEAYDRVVKTDHNTGLFLPGLQWRVEKEVQKAWAETEYSSRNCALLK